MPYLPPPQSDTEKNEFLAPDFPADSSQFFRVHGFTSAVRQMPTAMRSPFAWTNVSSGKNACFAIWPHVGTQFFNLSHHFLSMDGWPGDAMFFLASLRRSSTRIRPKKGPAPWILFLTPAPRPLQVTFFWLVKLNICGCTPFARTNVFSEKKRLFCNLGALTQNS